MMMVVVVVVVMMMMMRKLSRGDFQDFLLYQTYLHSSIVFLNYYTSSEGNIQVKKIFFRSVVLAT
jgi:hypothetical protein